MIGLIFIAAGLAIVIRLAVSQRSIPHGVLAAMIAVFYGVRAIGVGLNVDDPYPGYLFSATSIDHALDRFGAILLIFCISLAVGDTAFKGMASSISRVLPFPRQELRLQPLMSAMVLLSGIALIIALYQTASYGGIQGAIVAAKSERVSGQGLLRIPATMALILSCAGFHAIPRGTEANASHRALQVISAACIGASVLSASLWGSRQFIVLALAYVFGAPAIHAFRQSQRGWWIKSAIVSTVVIAVGFGLRIYRDNALGGETAVSAAQGNLFRQISISANGTTLDSSLLAAKDFPAHAEYRGGQDFITGIYGAMPASLRPDNSEIDTVGAAFHRLYEPTATSGWPIGAPTEWYINFGWIGVVVGGLVSGIAYKAINAGMHRSGNPELGAMVGLLLTLIVFPLGISASTPNRFVIHIVPLILILGALSLVSRLSGANQRRSPRRARSRARYSSVGRAQANVTSNFGRAETRVSIARERPARGQRPR